jgi:hypothetical protein
MCMGKKVSDIVNVDQMAWKRLQWKLSSCGRNKGWSPGVGGREEWGVPNPAGLQQS